MHDITGRSAYLLYPTTTADDNPHSHREPAQTHPSKRGRNIGSSRPTRNIQANIATPRLTTPVSVARYQDVSEATKFASIAHSRRPFGGRPARQRMTCDHILCIAQRRWRRRTSSHQGPVGVQGQDHQPIESSWNTRTRLRSSNKFSEVLTWYS